MFNTRFCWKKYLFKDMSKIKKGGAFGRLKRINGIYINFNGKICFVIRANWGTSSVTERTKLLCQGTTYYRKRLLRIVNWLCTWHLLPVIGLKKEKQLNRVPKHSITQNTICLQIKMPTFYESHAVSRDTQQGPLKKITALHSTGARLHKLRV